MLLVFELVSKVCLENWLELGIFVVEYVIMNFQITPSCKLKSFVAKDLIFGNSSVFGLILLLLFVEDLIEEKRIICSITLYFVVIIKF